MSHLVSRLILAMLTVPIAVAVLFFGVAVTASSGPPSNGLIVGLWAVTDLVCGLYWYLLWRDSVRWTRGRIGWTVAGVLAAIATGVVAGVVAHGLPGRPPTQIATFAGGGVTAICAVLFTVLAWRETPRERLERLARGGPRVVVCPACGYNLTGLRELRCPECGAAYTIDELLTAQPGPGREGELE